MNVSKIPISFNIGVLKISLIVEGLYYKAQRTDKTCSFSFHDPELNPELYRPVFVLFWLYALSSTTSNWTITLREERYKRSRINV